MKNVKKLIGIGIVLVSLVIALAGCATDDKNKVNNTVKQVEGQILNTVENNTNDKDSDNKANNTNKVSYAEADAEIKKLLKDEKWVKENLENENLTDTTYRLSELTVFKMADQNGMPVYISNHVESMAGAPYIKVITYKDGKVVVSNTPIVGEYAYVKINRKLNQVAIINDYTQEGRLYQITDAEFSKFGYNYMSIKGVYEDGYFSINEKEVSRAKYEEYLNNMELENDIKSNDKIVIKSRANE